MNKEKIKNMLKEKNVKYDYKYHAFKISEQYNLNYNDIVQLMEFTDNNEYFNMGFQKLLIGLHIKDVIEFVFVTRTLNECQTHTEINKALAEYFNINKKYIDKLWDLPLSDKYFRKYFNIMRTSADNYEEGFKKAKKISLILGGHADD